MTSFVDENGSVSCFHCVIYLRIKICSAQINVLFLGYYSDCYKISFGYLLLYLRVCCFWKMLRNYYFNCSDFEIRRMWKKSSSISTKETAVNLYTRISHFCMAVLKLRRKMYFAVWYFNAPVCFIMFVFHVGISSILDKAKITFKPVIIRGLPHTYSPFLYHLYLHFS